MDPIRVLRFATPFDDGPAERQSRGLRLDPERFAPEYRRAAVRPLFSLGAVAGQLRLARHIGQRGVQVVHTHGFYGNAFAVPAAWLAGAPVVIASGADRGVHLTATQRRIQRWVCGLADCVLAESDAIKAGLISDGQDASKIVVVRAGIEPAPPGRGAGRIRALVGVSDEAPVVLALTPCGPGTGIGDLVDAAAILSWNRPDVRVLIRSDESDDTHERFILERIQRLGLQQIVRWVGADLDIETLLTAANVAVYPASDDRIPLPLLAAMAAGVPVVATRTAGPLEAVDDAANGLLVPPGDPQSLAGAVARLISIPELARALSSAARRKALDRFSLDRVVHDLEHLYLDLLVRKAARPDWRIRMGLARRPFEGLHGWGLP